LKYQQQQVINANKLKLTIENSSASNDSESWISLKKGMVRVGKQHLFFLTREGLFINAFLLFIVVTGSLTQMAERYLGLWPYVLVVALAVALHAVLRNQMVILAFSEHEFAKIWKVWTYLTGTTAFFSLVFGVAVAIFLFGKMERSIFGLVWFVAVSVIASLYPYIGNEIFTPSGEASLCIDQAIFASAHSSRTETRRWLSRGYLKTSKVLKDSLNLRVNHVRLVMASQQLLMMDQDVVTLGNMRDGIMDVTAPENFKILYPALKKLLTTSNDMERLGIEMSRGWLDYVSRPRIELLYYALGIVGIILLLLDYLRSGKLLPFMVP